MGDEKRFSDKIEDTVVNAYGAIGGTDAAKDARAAWDAGRSGHLINSLKLSLKTDSDIVASVINHDHKPLDTPSNHRISSNKSSPSR
jgi:hypothetical protein